MPQSLKQPNEGLYWDRFGEDDTLEWWTQQQRLGTIAWINLVSMAGSGDPGAKRRVSAVLTGITERGNKARKKAAKKARKELEKSSKRKVVLKFDGSRKKTLDLSNDAHTLVLDLEVFRQDAIADFVKKLCEGTSVETRLKEAAMAAAMGYFDVSVESFYPHLDGVHKLNDATLAQYVRWTIKKEHDRAQQS